MTNLRRVDVRLGHTLAPPWSRVGQTWACGFAFRPGQTTPDDALALARAFDALPFDDAAQAADTLTGSFAVVRADDGPDGPHAFAVADALRSYPVFYGSDGDTLVLTDDAFALARRLGARPNLDHAAAFLLSGNVLGPDTLARNVFALQAGERLDVTPEGLLQTRRVHRFGGEKPEAPASRSSTAWEDAALAAFDAAFARTVAALGDRVVAVPLSGGLDSRMLVAMLMRHGVRPVCFAYGRPASTEVRRSQVVAEAFGLPWHVVPYSAQQWHRWGQRADYRAFRRYASRLVAIEHEQDWPAVEALVQSGRLPLETVVMPGHAPTTTGGQLGTLFAPSNPPPDLAEMLLARFFALWPRHALPSVDRDRLRSQLDRVLGAEASPTLAEAAWRFEAFGWQERQAKMIGNSVRAYEVHGLDWRLPFWDAPLFAFWSGVPLDERRDRALYRRVAARLLSPAVASVPYAPLAAPRWVQLIHVALDATHRRYGLFLGPHPEWTALTRRVSDLVQPGDAPIVHVLARPWRHLPPQRVPINGLLALKQWQSTVRLLETS